MSPPDQPTPGELPEIDERESRQILPFPLANGAGLPSTLRGELLDPAYWREGLDRYARAMKLAVALTDADGHLLGECQNP